MYLYTGINGISMKIIMWWNAHSHELHVKKNVKFTYMLSAFYMNKFYLHRYLKMFHVNLF